MRSTLGSNVGFTILLKSTLTCEVGKLGNDPTTLRLNGDHCSFKTVDSNSQNCDTIYLKFSSQLFLYICWCSKHSSPVYCIFLISTECRYYCFSALSLLSGPLHLCFSRDKSITWNRSVCTHIAPRASTARLWFYFIFFFFPLWPWLLLSCCVLTRLQSCSLCQRIASPQRWWLRSWSQRKNTRGLKCADTSSGVLTHRETLAPQSCMCDRGKKKKNTPDWMILR